MFPWAHSGICQMSMQFPKLNKTLFMWQNYKNYELLVIFYQSHESWKKLTKWPNSIPHREPVMFPLRIKKLKSNQNWTELGHTKSWQQLKLWASRKVMPILLSMLVLIGFPELVLWDTSRLIPPHSIVKSYMKLASLNHCYNAAANWWMELGLN